MLHSCKIEIQVAKGEMGGPEIRLGFLDLLLIVWFSGTSGSEFRDEPTGAGRAEGKLGELRPEQGWSCAPSPLSLPLGPYLLSGSPGLLAGSPGQNRGALVKQ